MSAAPLDTDRLTSADLPVRFGRYMLLEVLGEGATARVFRAELQGPAGFRKPCALKVMRATARALGSAESHLLDEARIGGRLLHPNLVETYDVGERDGRLFVAMQLVDGLTARQLARAHGPVPGRALAELARQLAEGLAHAHTLVVDGRAADLVHRDLKPANVLIGREGAARIADFGIARATGLSTGDAPSGIVWGTLGYMAPEQAYGRSATQASDVFALGLVVTELALGKRFAPVRTMKDYAGALQALPPELPGLARALDARATGLGAVITRCLANDPDARYPHARALAEALRGVTLPDGPTLADVVQASLQPKSTGPVPPEQSAEGDQAPSAQHTLASLAAEARPKSEVKPFADEVNAFIGRTESLARLTAGLEGEARVVGLWGLGGIGKTRLAREVARRLASRLRCSVVLCELADARRLDDALQRLAGALSVPAEGSEFGALAGRIGAALASRGPAVVVLDAYDGLTGHTASTLGRWRAAAPDVRFILTARERPSLSAGEGESRHALIERLEALDAVESFDLLVARIADQHPGFSPSEREVEALEQLALALDGVPLALELTAGQLQPGEPEALDALVAQAHASGPEGSASLDPLRAALAWSWARLSAWERDALAQLTVFRGGFSVEAAAEVIDLSSHVEAPWPMFAVERLLERSLLRVLSSAGAQGEARFGMLLSVQAFASEHLAGRRPEVLARHVRHFAKFGMPDALRSLETRGGAERLRALSLDAENLALATETALAALNPEQAAGAALALAAVCEVGAPGSSPLRLIQRVLAMDTPRRLRAWLCLKLATIWRQIARAEEAASIAEEVARMASDANDAGLEARALELWAAASMDGVGARAAKARAACARGIDRAQAAADEGATGLLLARLGEIELRDANFDLARSYASQAIAVHARLGFARAESHARTTLGETELQLGELDAGAHNLRTAAHGARALEDRASEATATLQLARLAVSLDESAQALRLGERARSLFHGLGHRRAEARVLAVLGEAHLMVGDARAARAHLEAAVALSDDLSDGAGMGASRAALASVAAAEGDLNGARALCRAAEGFLREAQDAAALARALCRRGHVELSAGNLVGAWAAHDEAAHVVRELGLPAASPLGRALAALHAALTDG
jgi:serine/threonine protein kinase